MARQLLLGTISTRRFASPLSRPVGRRQNAIDLILERAGGRTVGDGPSSNPLPRTGRRGGNSRMTHQNPSRREFLQVGAAGLATAGLAGAAVADDKKNEAGVPVRPLGKTGEMVSLMCL